MNRIDIGTDILMVGGDIAPSVSGDIDLIGGDDNLIQSIINNLCTVYGEVETDLEKGNKAYIGRTKLTDSGMEMVKADCRNAILYDDRVKEVKSIDVVRTSGYNCVISFKVVKYDNTVVDGTTSINLGEV